MIGAATQNEPEPKDRLVRETCNYLKKILAMYSLDGRNTRISSSAKHEGAPARKVSLYHKLACIVNISVPYVYVKCEKAVRIAFFLRRLRLLTLERLGLLVLLLTNDISGLALQTWRMVHNMCTLMSQKQDT